MDLFSMILVSSGIFLTAISAQLEETENPKRKKIASFGYFVGILSILIGLNK